LYALSGTIKTPKGTGQWQRDDDAVIWLESKQKKSKKQKHQTGRNTRLTMASIFFTKFKTHAKLAAA